MKIIVVIPTYKEAGEIGKVIDALCGPVFKAIPNHEMGILVVDGNSPDGTAEILREKSIFYPNLYFLIEPKKRGIGVAYIEGIKYAIKELGADAIIEFDGDGQHNPKDVVRLVTEFDNGHDYVIGSRYVPGGAIPAEWSLHRKLLSRFGSLTARAVLNLPTRDNTSGFKLSRVAGFAENLPLDENKILSKYYAYKIHFLYNMISMGAKTKEIPIVFLERKSGSSKSTFRDIYDSLRVVFALKFRRKKYQVFPNKKTGENLSQPAIKL